MPIRPELRHFYRGPAWRAIRARILERAGHKCERCAAPNRTLVLRQFSWWTPATLAATVWSQNGYFIDGGKGLDLDGAVIENAGDRQFIRLPWKAPGDKGVIQQLACFPMTGEHRWVSIVLTIAHLDHDPANNADDNLAALCQWCHLNHDRGQHAANARRTRAEKTGQTWILPELEARV